MAWYPDLSPCDYFSIESAKLIAIGWLERGHQFSVGTVDPSIYLKLESLLKDPWQPMLFRGMHDCELCLYEGPSGFRNLFVPGEGVIYVCPELVVHYMNAHHYQPPQEFCDAVSKCPDMKSMNYSRAILANGGRPLVKSVGKFL